MNRIAKTIGVAFVACGLCACAIADSPPEGGLQSSSATTTRGNATQLSGQWSGSLTDPQGMRHPITMSLNVDSGVVTGTLTGGPPDGAEQPIVNGKLTEDRLTFQLKLRGPQGGTVLFYFDGHVRGDRIEGGHGLKGESFPWEASKQSGANR